MLSESKDPVLISIVGPTAVGKTKIAVDVGQKLQTEIVSADSRQFFKEMTIGTAKPSAEELHLVKHHFVDSHSVNQFYSAGQYERDAAMLLKKLFKINRSVILAGGSTLYLKAIWEGFDTMPAIKDGVRAELNEVLASEEGLSVLLKELQDKDAEYFHVVDKKNGQRVVRALEVIRSSGKKYSSFRKNHSKTGSYQNLKIGLYMDRASLFRRIDQRIDIMISEGLFEEAEKLYQYRSHHALQTVGYREVFGFLEGKYDKDEAIRLMKRNSRRYAKRQLTWFRKYNDIHWFQPNQRQEIIELIQGNLNL